MAETILFSVFGMLASPVISKLVADIIFKLETDNTNNLSKDLKDLQTTILPVLELTILATKHRPPADITPLTKWLDQLRDAYIDAACILREVMSNVKKPALMSLGHGQKRLLKRLKKLKEVAAGAKDFRDLLGTVTYRRPVTSGGRTEHTVFGRDADREEIINFLLDNQGGSSSIEGYSVVVVTGMKGAGKTTLARYVFNDNRIVGHFDVRMWLCLSQNMNLTELFKQMIECASGNACPNIINVTELENRLINLLSKSGKIMVVLDDVWYDKDEGDQQWGSLLAPFALRKGTCKIMVTSRSSVLPRNLSGKNIEWRDLEPRHFKSFLRYHTIDRLINNNQQLENEWREKCEIVDQIAEKMSTMSIQPLEAEVVGTLLCNQPNINFWRDTLKVVDQFEQNGFRNLLSKESTLFPNAALERIN